MPATRGSSRATAAKADLVKLTTTKINSPKNSGADAQELASLSSSSLTVPEDDFLDFTVTDDSKPGSKSGIQCALRPGKPSARSSIFIFTHGAGGTISTPSVSNFANGYAEYALASKSKLATDTTVSTIVCFNGSMNLKSRTKMFRSVTKHCTSNLTFTESHPSDVGVFGGTSMGARAAVLAAAEDETIKTLVLTSYPLLGQNGDVRDQILLDVAADTEVLFLVGDKDSMCDIERLNDVRHRMKARSWLVTVEGAEHGINCRQKGKAQQMQLNAGRIAANWVNGGDARSKEGDLGLMPDCKMIVNLPIEKTDKKSSSKPETQTSIRAPNPRLKRKAPVTSTIDADSDASTSTKKARNITK